MTRVIYLCLSMAAASASLLGPDTTVLAQQPTTVRHKTVKIGDLDIFYREAGPKDAPAVLLLHGFPTSSQMFRDLIPKLAGEYRVVAPDYRGAGYSSRPRLDHGVPVDPRGREGTRRAGYDKWSMAEDLHELLHDHLGLPTPATVLGHDVGGMVAVAYALRYRDDTRAMIFGECPQPGTSTFEELKGDVRMFHFTFHALLDLPETLVAGREREYLQHFYDKLGYAPHLVDTEHYVTAFRQPGALRAGFDLYRAFEQDAEDVRRAIAEGGKLAMPVLGTSGVVGPFIDRIEAMTAEIAEHPQVAVIDEAAHWIAEENPQGLVDAVVAFDS